MRIYLVTQYFKLKFYFLSLQPFHMLQICFHAFLYTSIIIATIVSKQPVINHQVLQNGFAISKAKEASDALMKFLLSDDLTLKTYLPGGSLGKSFAVICCKLPGVVQTFQFVFKKYYCRDRYSKGR